MMGNPSSFQLALITGATSGIGLELARLLAKQGIALILIGRAAEVLAHLAAELSKSIVVETMALDLTQSAEVQQLVNVIHQRQPDLVVNNAGLGLYGEALEYPTQMHLNLIELNVATVTALTLEAVRTWRTLDRKGVVVNLSSVVDELPFPLSSTYAASKAFVTRFSESFDLECQPYGIRVLAACPGVVQTCFRERAGGSQLAVTGGVGKPMTAAFAAAQIWKQLQVRRQKYYFDWRYRLLRRVAFLLPSKWVAAINRRAIERFHPIGPLITISKDE